MTFLSLLAYVIVCSVLLSGGFCSSLSSSLHRSYACPDEVVTYTCTGPIRILVRWIVEPYVELRDNLFFETYDQIGLNKTKDNFTATLVSIYNTSNPNEYEITTTLSFSVSQVDNGTTITCHRGSLMDDLNLYFASFPSPPRNIRLTTIQTYTVIIEWDTPIYSGGAPVDSYTVKTNSSEEMITSDLKYNFTLASTNSVSLNITAHNCAGSSEPVLLNIERGKCLPPVLPANGSITELFSNNQRTAYVECNEGFFPSGPVMSICQNGTWNPDPRLVFCTKGCRTPESPANGVIVEGSHNVTLGAEITFGCNDGYSPEERMTAVCEESGWRPSPALLNCSKSATTSDQNGTRPVAIAIPSTVLLLVILVLVITMATVVMKRRIPKNKLPKLNITLESNRYNEDGDDKDDGMMEVRHSNGASNNSGLYSYAQVPQLCSIGSIGIYCTTTIANGAEPEVKLHYEDVQLRSVSDGPHPREKTEESVQYASVDHDAVAPPLAPTDLTDQLHEIDKKINPEIVQRQIVEIRPRWRSFGSAVGIGEEMLDQIHASYTEDKDKLAEVVYQWWGKGCIVTWRAVAKICRQTGFFDLAFSLDNAYRTGNLPFKDDDKVVLPSFEEEPAPPVPTRPKTKENKEDGTPPPPPPPSEDVIQEMQLLSSQHIPETQELHSQSFDSSSVSSDSETSQAPPRPPKPSTLPRPSAKN